MPSGILIVDKPADWTSHDVVAKLRRILGERRIGHAGTLDPMATGVLPVFVGRATRAVEFAAGGDKEYLATLRLGVVTDTQDTTGTVLAQHPVKVSDEEIDRALARFRGAIEQIPPMYSAVKQGGKKLYELARAGKEVARAPRPVTIYEMERLGRCGDEVFLRVSCSKGTYVRTLCHDIGAVLGCGGAMSALRRSRAAGYGLDQAMSLDALAAMDAPETALLPTDSLFAAHPALTVSAQDERRIRNGMNPDLLGEDGMWRVYGETGEFLAIARREKGQLSVIKRFLK